jgi:hypothetical protein
MSKYHPAKGSQHWGAFAAGNDSSLAAGGASTPGTDRDASHVLKRINYSYYKGESGKTLVNNEILVKRPDPSSPRQRIQRQLEVQKNPACEQRNGIEDYHYIHKDISPEWVLPRTGIVDTVSWRFLEHDADNQE